MRKFIIFCLLFLALFMLEGFNFSHEGENYQKLKRAEKLFEQNKFEEAEKLYGEISTEKYREALTLDRTTNLYAGKKYGKVAELYEKWGKENLNSEYLFNIGNSYKFTGDYSEKTEDKVINYRKALQAYKYAMLKSSDMDIKKNFEITSKLLKEIENSNKQNNSDNSDNSKKQGENQDSSKNKQKQKNSQNYNKNENSQNNKNSDSSGENKPDQSNEQQNNENNKNSDATSKNNANQDIDISPEASRESGAENFNEENSKDRQRLEELMYHLKDIENLEKEGLKNNQKILNQNFDTSDNSKNW